MGGLTRRTGAAVTAVEAGVARAVCCTQLAAHPVSSALVHTIGARTGLARRAGAEHRCSSVAAAAVGGAGGQQLAARGVRGGACQICISRSCGGCRIKSLEVAGLPAAPATSSTVLARVAELWPPAASRGVPPVQRATLQMPAGPPWQGPCGQRNEAHLPALLIASARLTVLALEMCEGAQEVRQPGAAAQRAGQGARGEPRGLSSRASARSRLPTRRTRRHIIGRAPRSGPRGRGATVLLGSLRAALAQATVQSARAGRDVPRHADLPKPHRRHQLQAAAAGQQRWASLPGTAHRPHDGPPATRIPTRSPVLLPDGAGRQLCQKGRQQGGAGNSSGFHGGGAGRESSRVVQMVLGVELHVCASQGGRWASRGVVIGVKRSWKVLLKEKRCRVKRS